LWANDDMVRQLTEAESEELRAKNGKPAAEEVEYEYVYEDAYGGDDGKEDGRSCTSLFGWDAIKVFFGAGDSGARRRRRRRKQRDGGGGNRIRRASTVDGRENDGKADAGGADGPKRRIGVSAEAGGEGKDDEDYTPVVHPKSSDEANRIRKILVEFFLFSACTEEQITEVINAMFSVQKKAGETIIRQGDEGDNFYIIDEGETEVYVKKDGAEKMVATIGKGNFFGELSLMYSQPRAATIKAKSPCTLWALDRVTFRRIIINSSSGKAKVYKSMLDKVKILDSLNAREKAELADALVETRQFNDGEYIITQGERGDSFYIIMEGNARITKSDKPGKGKEKDIATIGKGDYFGEMAILSDSARAASVIAKGKVKCLTLDRDTFTRLLGPAEAALKQKMVEYDKK
jgi:cAMP-dependent protein kinase regulator